MSEEYNLEFFMQTRVYVVATDNILPDYWNDSEDSKRVKDIKNRLSYLKKELHKLSCDIYKIEETFHKDG